MENTMYALIYCYEGRDNNYPFSSVIAISNDIEKLKNKMINCVNEDCELNQDDEWDDDKNYEVIQEYHDMFLLQHKKHINLYATYKLQKVDII